MELKVNWPKLIALIGVWGASCGLIAGLTTLQALDALRRGVPLPKGSSWPLAIGIDMFCLGAFWWLARKVFDDVNTKITEDYISQVRLFGTSKIFWLQAEKISTEVWANITVYGPHGRITFRTRTYVNGEEVEAKILQLAARHSIAVQ